VIQRGGGLRLPNEPVRVRGSQKLDCYETVQTRITGLENFAHATRAKPVDNFVRTYLHPAAIILLI
jgi:hypothetical protein